MHWETALQQHDRWLRTVVFSRVGEAEAVDEIMQEIALAAAGQSVRPDVPERIAPWLYRVAIRQTLLYRRKCGRRRRLAGQYAERHVPVESVSKASDPLDWLLAQERRTLVRSAMRRLAARDAEILQLKYSEDWTCQQIAQHLGLSQSAVEARLHRARKRLRDELAARDRWEKDRES
ncbi:MAG: sigma-70 family RNA polymerase sigma factor [Pirellulaceae bacterium]|nr:sigma-70 family RNA polymerase sigma factor [Pirellulaceae bacterium]